MIVHTVGHSTRTLAELVELLRGSDIALVADVRRFPRSRRHPHFNAEALGPALEREGIGYRHLVALGGRRDAATAKAPSRNTLWREAAFQAYSDYAETAEFRAGLDALLGLASERRVAIMCAEAVWWRCHRRIITDYLLARQVDARHILGPGKVEPASLTPGAVVEGDGRLSYRKPEDGLRLPGI